jgi:hypothetical protein
MAMVNKKASMKVEMPICLAFNTTSLTGLFWDITSMTIRRKYF